MKTKRILLIRHAQTEENKNFQSLIVAIEQLKALKFPRKHIWKSLSLLLNLHKETDLSETGTRQIADLAVILKDASFWKSYRPELIVHSPMVRAKRTCCGILDGYGDFPSEPSEAIVPDIVENKDLKEAALIEYLFSKSLDDRIQKFEKWLSLRKESTIVVIGHRDHFRRMLKQNIDIRNCDVWQSNLVVKNEISPNACAWTNLRLLYRTHLALPHPFDADYRGEYDTDSDDDDKEVEHKPDGCDPNVPPSGSDDGDDLNDCEPSCRICHVTQSEAPTLKLIKPCLCAGSLQYVHLSCLNQWRATSPAAQFSCSTCNFQYHVRRSPLADIVMSERGAVAITALIVLAIVLATGCVFNFLASLIKIDVVHKLCNLARLDPWWRYCDSETHRVWEYLLAWPTGLTDVKEKMRFAYSVIDSNSFFPVMMCTSASEVVFETLLLGGAAVGLAGMAFHIYSEVLVARMDGEQGRNRLFVLGSWLMSMGMGRLGLLIGCAMSARAIYGVVIVSGRRIAQSIGETILELPPQGQQGTQR